MWALDPLQLRFQLNPERVPLLKMSLPVLRDLEYDQPHNGRSRHKKNQPVFPERIEYMTE